MKILSCKYPINEIKNLASRDAQMSALYQDSQHGLKKLGINPNAQKDDSKPHYRTVEMAFGKTERDVKALIARTSASGGTTGVTATPTSVILPKMEVYVQRIKKGNLSTLTFTDQQGSNELVVECRMASDAEIVERMVFKVLIVSVKGDLFLQGGIGITPRNKRSFKYLKFLKLDIARSGSIR